MLTDFERGLTVAGVAALTANHYFKRVAAHFGGFPPSCLCFDCETTGFSTGSDLIVQLGHCLVLDGEVVEDGNVETLLDWTRCPFIDQAWLRQRLLEVTEAVKANGGTYCTNYEHMREYGVEPVEALRAFHELLLAARAAGCLFAGHNAWAFDMRMLRHHFQRWLNTAWDLGPDELWDSGMIEKASQGGLCPDSTDSLKSFALRVANLRWKGVFWKLSDTIVRHGLAHKHNLDMAAAHGAKFDAFCCHLLLEHYRHLSETAV